MLNILPVLAQQASPAAAPGGGSPFGMLITMGLIFAIFYFMMVRPQQRTDKERQKTINNMRAGKKVLFAGGLIGTVAEVREHTFMIEIAPGTKIEVARGAISSVLDDDTVPKVEPGA